VTGSRLKHWGGIATRYDKTATTDTRSPPWTCTRSSVATSARPRSWEAVGLRSQAEVDERTDQLRKIRSCVLREDDGALGAICLYEAVSPEAIREHARAADLPVDDVVKVSAIVVQRARPGIRHGLTVLQEQAAQRLAGAACSCFRRSSG
jgi:hypothetical protein